MADSAPRNVAPPIPPKNGTGREPRSANGIFNNKTATPARIRDGLITYFGMGELALAGMGDLWSAEVWHQGAPVCAEAWADLAAQNDAVRRALSKLIEGGAWGAAITTSIAMIAPIVAYQVPLAPIARMMLVGISSRLIDEEKMSDRMRAAMQAQEQAASPTSANGNGNS